MKLRTKTLVVVALTVGVAALSLYGLAQFVLLRSFADLEAREVRRNVLRALDALTQDIAVLNQTVADWAPWDDTYAFAADRNEAYIEDNLADVTLVNLRVDVILITNATGEVIVGKAANKSGGPETPLPESVQKRILQDPLLSIHRDTTSYVSGAILLPEGPLLVASRPILTSTWEGPIRGTMVMGRYLDAEAIKRLADVTHLSLDIRRLDEPLPPDAEGVRAPLLAGSPVVSSVLDADLVAGYALVRDVSQAPILMLRVDQSREVYRTGRTSISYYLVSLLTVGLVLLLVLVVSLRRTTLDPLARLSRHVVAVGQTGDLTTRLASTRRDEIGVLGREFDRMVAQLAEARKRLEEQSFRAGQAEMATLVLHELRNELAPLAGSLGLVQQRLHDMPLARIEQTRAELDNEATDVQRREDLERFLRLAHERVVSYVPLLMADFQNAMETLSRVECILADHSSLNDEQKTVDESSMQEVLSDAIASLPAALRGGTPVEIEPGVAGLAKLRGPRVVLQEILAAIVANALASVSEMGTGSVTISAGVEDDGGREVVHVVCQDTGAGIEAERLTAIFGREQGGTGWGWTLHRCANALNAMGGGIRAESAGPGRGACFHVFFPREGCGRSAREDKEDECH